MDSFEKEVALYSGKKEITASYKYRVVGFAMFMVAVLLLLTRILVYYLPIKNDTVTDVVFSCIIQLFVLVTVPFLIYKFFLKMTAREIFAFSNFRKTKWYNLVLMIPIGIFLYFVQAGISSLWQVIIMLLGYTHSSGTVYYPANFGVLLFFLNIIITAVLPGFCEEFFCRGGFLTTMRKSLPFVTTIIICGVQFGLFHQNITQVFYTAVYGSIMGFMTLKLKSIFPAMILHFTNNAMSVYLEFSGVYGWWGGNFDAIMQAELFSRPLLLFVAYIVMVILVISLISLVLYLNSSKRLEKKREVIKESGFDHTNNRVVLMGEEDKEMVRELGLDKEVYGKKLEEDLYKPTFRDNMFFIGAIVVAVLSTVFSFIWGALF